MAEAVIDDEAAFRAIEERIVPGCPRRVWRGGGGRRRCPLSSQKVRDALVTVRVVWLELGLVDAARRTGLSGAAPCRWGNVRGQLHDMLKQRHGLRIRGRPHRAHRWPPAHRVADEIEAWEAS